MLLVFPKGFIPRWDNRYFAHGLHRLHFQWLIVPEVSGYQVCLAHELKTEFRFVLVWQFG